MDLHRLGAVYVSRRTSRSPCE